MGLDVLGLLSEHKKQNELKLKKILKKQQEEAEIKMRQYGVPVHKRDTFNPPIKVDNHDLTSEESLLKSSSITLVDIWK